MARLPTKLDVIRALFAYSGNQCAFEGCTQVLINHKYQFVGQVCHIEAANTGGERYNSNSTDEERRSYDNLILFCYAHHIETDDVEEFTVGKLKSIKDNHVRKYRNNTFILNKELLSTISKEMSEYWKEVETLNKVEHIYQDLGLAMKISSDRAFIDIIANFNNLFKAIERTLLSLHESDIEIEQEVEKLLAQQGINTKGFDKVRYYENPLINRNWDTHNLAVPNLMLMIRIDLIHAEIKFFEEYFKNNEGSTSIKNHFERLKTEFKGYAQSATHAD